MGVVRRRNDDGAVESLLLGGIAFGCVGRPIAGQSGCDGRG